MEQPISLQLSHAQYAEVMRAIDAQIAAIESNIHGMRPDPGLEAWAEDQLKILRRRLLALNNAKDAMLAAIGQ